MLGKLSAVLSIALLVLFAGCAGTQARGASGENTQLANPASVFCEEKGGRLEIRDGPGGQIGYCIFQNGRECEEWSFYRGECSQNAPVKNETPTAKTPAKEGELCGGIAGIPCVEGLECRILSDYPDAGGLCMRKTKPAPVFNVCPLDRAEVCTMEYNPVCGRSGSTPSLYDYEDYPSPCVACSKSSPALGYFQGACASHNLTQKARDPQTLYDCPSIRYSYCTDEIDPVCGRLVDPSASLSAYMDYQNPCKACSVGANAIAYYVGDCLSRGVYRK